MDCVFYSEVTEAKVPYVKKLLNFDLEKRFIEYDGYFNVDDEVLPQKCLVFLSQCEDTPYKIENGVSFYKKIVDLSYEIEIYKREKFDNTNVYHYDEDYKMKVCLFPSNHEKIWFRLIATSSPVMSPSH